MMWSLSSITTSLRPVLMKPEKWISVQIGGPKGAAKEAIRRDRVKSSRVPLAALGTFSLAPSATLSFHKENSAIAEGLVPLRVPGLEFTGLGVLCLRCRPFGSPA